MNGPPFGSLDGGDQFSTMNLDFSNLDGPDVLDQFDFDSFLNTNGEGDNAFNFGDMAFDESLQAGGE